MAPHSSPETAATGSSLTPQEALEARQLADRFRLTGTAGWLAAFYILYSTGIIFGSGILIPWVQEQDPRGLITLALLFDWIGRAAVGAAILHRAAYGSSGIRTGLATRMICAVFRSCCLMALDQGLAGAGFALISGALSLGYDAAWLQYFKRSRRVQYTLDTAQAQPSVLRPLHQPPRSGTAPDIRPCRPLHLLPGSSLINENRENPSTTQPTSVYEDRYAEVVAEAQRGEKERLTGVGGWLILYIAVQMLDLVLYSYSFINSGGEELDSFSEGLDAAMAAMDSLQSILTPLGGVLQAFMLFTLFLLFNRKKSTPKMSIILLGAQAALSIFSMILMQQTLAPYANEGGETSLIVNAFQISILISTAVGVGINLIWIAYFIKSKRVAYTFTQ